MTDTAPIIEVKNLSTYLGEHWVHKDLNLTVNRGEILAIIGGSGCGKTTLIREMLMLMQPTSGTIRIFDHDLLTLDPNTRLSIQTRWGVLFQQNALFSSLTVLDNVAFPLREHTTLDHDTIKELALLKILLADLSADAAIKFPSELSGGMEKRAALARAIVLDPELIFLDEPTAGLDPGSASALDDLILNLQTTMGLTIVMITHDLDSLWRVADRIAFLGEGKVLAVEPLEQLIHNQHPLIQDYFSGPRGSTMKELIALHGSAKNGN